MIGDRILVSLFTCTPRLTRIQLTEGIQATIQEHHIVGTDKGCSFRCAKVCSIRAVSL